MNDIPMTVGLPTTGKRLFNDDDVATNMPFFDGNTLVFCQSTGMLKTSVKCTGSIWKSARRNKVLADRIKNLPRSQDVTYRPWKMAYCSLEDMAVRTIRTGIPEHITERSPAFYREGGRISLSFISGVATSAGFMYRLYVCSGPNLSELGAPEPIFTPPLYFGFVSPHHICWGARSFICLKEKATGNTFGLSTTFYRIASVTFPADNPGKLLITGLINKEFESQTVLYDMASEEVSDVSVGGPVYKASMYANRLFFAQRQEGKFEDRALFHGEYSLSPSGIQISKS